MTITKKDAPLIGVVGPCSAGKTTLISALESHGVRARHIAQEHSYVKEMWKRFTNPDILIFLDVSYPVAQERRQLNWNEDEYAQQQKRLAHARSHTDFYLLTDGMSPDDVLQKVMGFLKELSDA